MQIDIEVFTPQFYIFCFRAIWDIAVPDLRNKKPIYCKHGLLYKTLSRNIFHEALDVM